MRKYSKEQSGKKKFTLELLLLLVRLATPRGKRGAVNFFFLEGGGVEAADGCSSSKEEEETLAFFYPFGGREAMLFLLGCFVERLASTLLALGEATIDLPFFPAFVFLAGVFLGEGAGPLGAFSTA